MSFRRAWGVRRGENSLYAGVSSGRLFPGRFAASAEPSLGQSLMFASTAGMISLRSASQTSARGDIAGRPCGVSAGSSPTRT
jgi:hypothetical protein